MLLPPGRLHNISSCANHHHNTRLCCYQNCKALESSRKLRVGICLGSCPRHCHRRISLACSSAIGHYPPFLSSNVLACGTTNQVLIAPCFAIMVELITDEPTRAPAAFLPCSLDEMFAESSDIASTNNQSWLLSKLKD